jgi:hypothetical protein
MGHEGEDNGVVQGEVEMKGIAESQPGATDNFILG